MATKKKTKKKQSKPAKNSSKKKIAREAGRQATVASRKISARKRVAPGKNKSASKKAAPKKAGAKKTAPGKKPAARVTTSSKRAPGKIQNLRTISASRQEARARSGGQSGDLQGLNIREDVDSESVSELIEEGNAFEADVVKGVEDADNADESEVHTHEVPEDDVPEEYLDKD